MDWKKTSEYSLECETHTIARCLVNGKSIYVLFRRNKSIRLEQYDDSITARDAARLDLEINFRAKKQAG